MLNTSEIVDDIVLDWQLRNGWSPSMVLYAHYDEASHVVISHSYSVSSDRMEMMAARDSVAGVGSEFFKSLAEATKSSLFSILKLFKDSRVVKFFSKIGWSFKAIYGLLKRGMKAYRTLQKAISEYVAETKVGKWTKEKLEDLDEFLKRHPNAKKIAGVAVGAMLIYFWFNQSFIGDPVFDFDMTYIISALGGSFSLVTLIIGTIKIHSHRVMLYNF